ncbi:MAG: hypothetical protein JMDDDDMK_03731 [Acidobacteria bacterium]|nr:hypothetical protein [Acidobacteriota bacterium]
MPNHPNQRSRWASITDQPRMRVALEALQHAREQLEQATPNKGGHRMEAIRLIEQAIYEVEAGVMYARNH